MKTRLAVTKSLVLGLMFLTLSSCASWDRRRLYIPAFPDFQSKAVATFDARYGRDKIWTVIQDLGNDQSTRDYKQFLRELESMQIRYYAFKDTGAYSQGDVDSLSSQLTSAGWSRASQARAADTKTIMEVFAAVEDGEPVGYMMLMGRPKDLLIINLVGKLDVETFKKVSVILADPKNLSALTTDERRKRRQRDRPYTQVQPSVTGAR